MISIFWGVQKKITLVQWKFLSFWDFENFWCWDRIFFCNLKLTADFSKSRKKCDRKIATNCKISARFRKISKPKWPQNSPPWYLGGGAYTSGLLKKWHKIGEYQFLTNLWTNLIAYGARIRSLQLNFGSCEFNISKGRVYLQVALLASSLYAFDVGVFDINNE